ncbi:hydantoinase/oxoprolinase family protein [Bacillus licheniformis]|nr:hydantoinase/oxoprolinase family protein [Bacillus licheniformis]
MMSRLSKIKSGDHDGNWISRYRVALPMMDIHTIGSGGGSIAWIDSGGALQVGPRSAGSNPGPACYGRGGEEPTVTDVNVFLGYINPDNFLGGEMKLDRSLAEKPFVHELPNRSEFRQWKPRLQSHKSSIVICQMQSTL